MIQVITEHTQDRYNLCLISFYCIGFLMEVSNLFIVNAGVYWNYKFRNTTALRSPSSNVTYELQEELHSLFSSLKTVIPIAVMLADIFFLKKWNTIYKMMACFSGYICIFLMIISCTIIDTDSWQNQFFYIIIAVGIILLILKNVLIATLMFMCSGFPLVYIAGITSGQAICGILSSGVWILILVVDASPRTSGLLYFSVALLCVVITFTVFLMSLRYSKFSQHRFQQLAIRQKNIVNPKLAVVASVFKRQRAIFFTLLLVAGTTAMVQPGLTSTIDSKFVGQEYEWNDKYFVPVITFLLFYSCDFCGKELAGRVAGLVNNSAMLVTSICRFVLVPLVLVLNVTLKYDTGYVFKSDLFYVIYEVLLGITNGLGINMSIVNASKKYEDTEVQEKSFTVVLMLLGLLLADVFTSLKPMIAKLIY